MNTKEQINIFIVDDNKIFTLALKENIEASFVNMPIKIESFITGETCMMKFNEVKPHVVILDYHLNSRYFDAEDGIKVLEGIKKEYPDTNVIMLSSNDTIDIAIKSFNHGAFDYVVKTETKFKKINNSLSNLFKIIDTKNDAKKYRYMVVGLLLAIAFMIGLVVAVKVFAPSVTI